MMRRQCIPARPYQYVNHDPRLIFKAWLVFKARPLLAQLRQTPGQYSRPGLYLRPGFYSRKYGIHQKMLHCYTSISWSIYRQELKTSNFNETQNVLSRNVKYILSRICNAWKAFLPQPVRHSKNNPSLSTWWLPAPPIPNSRFPRHWMRYKLDYYHYNRPSPFPGELS